jgi:hypothetical protein
MLVEYKPKLNSPDNFLAQMPVANTLLAKSDNLFSIWSPRPLIRFSRLRSRKPN